MDKEEDTELYVVIPFSYSKENMKKAFEILDKSNYMGEVIKTNDNFGNMIVSKSIYKDGNFKRGDEFIDY